MIQAAIVTRRLKPGKTYADFRKAWYHTVGFGTKNKMLTILNVADPSEIIVIGFNETTIEQVRQLINIDIKERGANPLDDVIEPKIDRKFGVLIAEDDFSSEGSIEYKPAAIDGKLTDFTELKNAQVEVTKILAQLKNMGKF